MNLQNLIANLSPLSKLLWGIGFGLLIYAFFRLLIYFVNKEAKSLKTRKLTWKDHLQS